MTAFIRRLTLKEEDAFHKSGFPLGPPSSWVMCDQNIF